MKSWILSTVNPALQSPRQADLWVPGPGSCLPLTKFGLFNRRREMCQLLLLATARSSLSSWQRRETGDETAAYLYCINLKFSGPEVSLINNTNNLHMQLIPVALYIPGQFPVTWLYSFLCCFCFPTDFPSPKSHHFSCRRVIKIAINVSSQYRLVFKV